MPAICMYFQVHQPYRLRRYTVFDLGQNSIYEDDDRNCDTLLHAARFCYLPMNTLLLKLIQRHGQRFRVAFSISGTALDQFEQYAPEVINTFKALANTGCVEFLAETDSHSLAFLYAREEFQRQVATHSERIKALFGKEPRVFRNTELIYNNELASVIEDMGFAAILAEGADHVLGWRSPNFVYQPVNCQRLKILLKNYNLSDDIAVRFGNTGWDEWPLTADKFASWCHAVKGMSDTLNVFMNYETFGLSYGAPTGIFQFMEALPAALLKDGDFYFRTPSEVATASLPMGRIDVPRFMSWADAERDLNTWLGNDMQKDAIHALYALEPKAAALHADADMRRTWQRLQSAEHFAYMCTKWFSAESDVGRLGNPYGSPYDAYINYMNVLADFELALNALPEVSPEAPPEASLTRASHTTSLPQTKPTAPKASAQAPAPKTSAKAKTGTQAHTKKVAPEAKTSASPSRTVKQAKKTHT